jgi:PKD repeat protein
LQYRWDFYADGVWDTDYSSDPTAEYLWLDEYSGSVSVEVTDGTLTDTATSTIDVANLPPIISAITAPLAPIPINTEITTSVEFTDPGVLDSHIVLWAWGDDTDPTPEGVRTYSTPGVYTVTVTVTDDDGGSARALQGVRVQRERCLAS